MAKQLIAIFSLFCLGGCLGPTTAPRRADGVVALNLRDGDQYQGDLKAGRREGRGSYHWANGDTYEGEWVDDRMSGQGTLTFANGEKYDGEFLDGRRNGYGTYAWPDGRIAKGFWDNDILVKR